MGRPREHESETIFPPPIELLKRSLAERLSADLALDYLGESIEQRPDQVIRANLEGNQLNIAFAVLWNKISCFLDTTPLRPQKIPETSFL